MLTPCNACPACLLAKNDRIGGDRLNLVNQGHVNPLGLSSEFRIPSSEFGNALCLYLPPQVPPLAGRSSSVALLLPFALYALRSALCAMLVTPLGGRPFFKKVSHKAPPTHIEGGAFLFCPLKCLPRGILSSYQSEGYSTGAETISLRASFGERSKRI